MADELQPIETPESIAKMYGIEPPPAAPTRPTVPSGPFAGMPVPKEPGGMGGPGVNLAPKPAAPVAAPTPTPPALTPGSLAKEYGIGSPGVPQEPKAVPEPAKAVPGGGLPEALAPTHPAAPAAPAGQLNLLGEVATGAKLGLIDFTKR